MRNYLCDALIARSANQDMIFLTGDLGFMALEPLKLVLGERFINAGIAEQNMVSVAAALSKLDMEVWVYSIAPFLYARALEQIRIDITFHNLPVRLIGNGGGYGYGVMGPTHHAIDDYGTLLALPNLSVYVPAFNEDVGVIIERASRSTRSSYIRMGKDECPQNYQVPAYAPWRQLISGEGAVVIVVGPLVGTYIEALQTLPRAQRPNLWVVSELPIDLYLPPTSLLTQITHCRRLYVSEEHVAHGGVGSDLLLYLAKLGVSPGKFKHLHAQAHYFERYGSQAYLRQQSGLDVASLLELLRRDELG